MPSNEATPATMRAMRLSTWGGKFELETRAVPSPGAGQVLVAVHSVGIGVTQELARRGSLGGSVPRIGGHEFAGTIAKMGPDVSGWSVGDRVVATFYLLCGECRWCADGRESLCERMGGYLGIAADGAFADYVLVSAAALVAIPGEVRLGDAGIASDAIATAYHALVARARVRPGELVAVIGASGGLGVHVLQVARAMGAGTLGVVRNPDKVEALKGERLADTVICVNPTSLGAIDEFADTADVVVDTHGSEESLATAQRILGRGGRLVILGHVPGTSLALDTERILLEEQEVMGTRYANRAEIAATLELVRRGAVLPIIRRTYPLQEVNEGLADAVAGRVLGRLRIDVAGGEDS